MPFSAQKAASHKSVDLPKALGPLDGAAIVVSNVVGGGIFIVPVLVAQSVPNAWGMLSIWLAGGVLAFAGAMAYAELATVYPRAGGEYIYLSEAFGPRAGFLTGWTSFVAGFSGAIAASSVGLASYLGRFVPAAGDVSPLLELNTGLVTFTVTPQAIVAITAIVGLSAIHVIGLKPGRFVQNILAALKVLLLIAFVVVGFSIGKGDISNFSSDGATVFPSSWVIALIPVMFSYSGWNAAAYVAEEMRDPERNVPLALGIGTVTVVVIYLLLNMLYIYAMPINELALVDVRVVDAAADSLFNESVAVPLAAASVIMIAASISAMVLAGPRVYYAMARDRQFFSSLARVHPTFRTPAVAILAQAVWASILVLTGTFVQLVEYTGFAVVLFSGIAVTALFVIRRRDPEAKPPFRAWGYPFAPLVFVAASFLMVLNAIWRTPVTSLFGLSIILLGIPVFIFFQRQAKRSEVKHDSELP
ncbi:MAG: amino acid permease [Rhodospirillaceae bacterium]|nr:amino acid permease [Rhodospirillaceae bacterium]